MKERRRARGLHRSRSIGPLPLRKTLSSFDAGASFFQVRSLTDYVDRAAAAAGTRRTPEWFRHPGLVFRAFSKVIHPMVAAAWMKQRIGAGLAVFLTAVPVGCGTEETSWSLEGEYLLFRINEQSLPYDHGGLGCCTYLSGRFEFDHNTYSVFLTARNRNTGVVFTASETGTFTRTENSLAFTPQSFEVQPLLLSTATLSEDTLTVGVGGEGPGAPDQLQMLFLRSEPLQ